MPSVGVLIIFNSGTYFSLIPIDIKRLIFYLILLITFILPVSILPFLKLQGIIKDYKLSRPKERLMPLLITGIIYAAGYYFVARFSIIPEFIQYFILSSTLLIILTMVITYKWKISIHMVGIGGLSGIVLALIKYHPINLHIYLYIIFLLSGIIGSIRLYLKEHIPLQVYLGYLLGFSIVFLTGLFA